ncbi:MAG: sigma-70 family RNA polymerase sigma factor [Flavisolibacter sp.]|nr:sigma-70 family RNA polymerase sigma factor [Flavisolibacter sp.]
MCGKGLKWRTGNNCYFAQGMTAEDLVQEGIKKLYTGERVWDYKKNEDLEKFLRDSVLKSMMNNLVRSKDNTIVQMFPEGTDRPLEEIVKIANPIEEHASDLLNRPENPEEIALAQEEKREQIKRDEEAQKIINRLTVLAKNDKEATIILECTMEGIMKPRLISEKTGFSIEQVYNGQKRFRRFIKKVREESKGGVGNGQ